MTETKPALLPWLMSEEELLDTPAALSQWFAQGGALKRNDFVRIAWHKSPSAVSVFVGGQDYQLPVNCTEQVANMCSAAQLTATDWQQIKRRSELTDLLFSMLADGAWTTEA